MRRPFALAALLAGCTQSGSLDLELSLPTAPELRPTDMTTVTVLATAPDFAPIANRSVIDGNHFSAGDLPVANDVQINVLLNDVSNRLVGIGEAPELVDIVGDKTATLTIPVRRPFVYAASGTTLYTYDPTLDPRDMRFQGKLDGVGMAQFAVSVGGDRLVVAGASSLQVVDTATHKASGGPIALPGAPMIRDISPVPGMAAVAVAHSGGIAIVKLDTGEVTNADLGPVDRVAVGPAADGKMVAYGLVARIAPPDVPAPLAMCTGTSSVVAVYVDAPTVVAPKPLSVAASGIAAAPSQPAVFLSLPCTGQLAKLEGDPTSETAQLTTTMMSDLKNAAVVSVLGDRVWGAGTKPSSPVCSAGTCTSASSLACPETSNNRVSYVSVGAQLVVQSVPLGGGNAVTVELPSREETMLSTDDAAESHSQVLRPLGITPLDFVVLPGGQYVSVVTKTTFLIESYVDPAIGLVLPCLKATTGDWELVDMASTSIGQRVRSKCDLTYRSGAYFADWKCADPPVAERPTQGDYMPLSVGALFGAR